MTGVDPVLIFGRDTLLLETRRQLLEREGYRVVAASEIAEVCEQLSAALKSLLILCHTLSAEEFEAARLAAVSHVPAVPLLVLETGPGPPCRTGRVNFVSVSTGPRGLLAMTACCLARTQTTGRLG